MKKWMTTLLLASLIPIASVKADGRDSTICTNTDGVQISREIGDANEPSGGKALAVLMPEEFTQAGGPSWVYRWKYLGERDSVYEVESKGKAKILRTFMACEHVARVTYQRLTVIDKKLGTRDSKDFICIDQWACE